MREAHQFERTQIVAKERIKNWPRGQCWSALMRLETGDQVVLDGQSYKIQSRVPAKHKFALQDFKGATRS
jgi:hypothetical protein